MRAGGLNTKIQLMRFVPAVSATNQKGKGTYEPWGGPIWAEVKCTKTQEAENGGAMAYVTAYAFYIRKREGITGNMRICWKGRTFELLGPPIDWKNEKTGLTLMAREVT